VTENRHYLFDTFNRFQTIDISRIEIRRHRGQLHSSRPHENQLRTDVGRASL
jgi:hypothetical protein